MRRMQYRIAEKLGMLRSTMMRTVTSRELAELVIMENLPWWEERFAKANAPAEVQSRQVITTLFGSKHLPQGDTGG
jgi:hypothetical protein